MSQSAERPSKSMGAAGTNSSSTMGRPPKPTGTDRSSTPKPLIRNVVISGKLPTIDGEVNVYEASPLAGFGAPRLIEKKKSRTARSGQYRVYYVNGMAGNPHKHQAQAGLVAAFSGGPVWGVYNASGGSVVDLAQSLSDASTDYETMETIVKENGGNGSDKARDALIALFEKGVISTGQGTIATLVKNLLVVGNAATAALFKQLCEPNCADVRIVAHSQGNLITANALGALAAWKKEEGALKNITVYAVASPVRKWPDGPTIVNYAFANDRLTYLDPRNEWPIYLSDVVVAEYDPITEEILRYGPAPKFCVPKQWGDDVVCAPVPQLTHNFYCYVEYYWDQLVGHFP